MYKVMKSFICRGCSNPVISTGRSSLDIGARANLEVVAFSALTLLVGRQKGIRPVKTGGWRRWALLSPDGVAPILMVSVSASINLPLRHKSRRSLLAPSHPGGPRKRAVKRLCVCVLLLCY